MGRMDKPNVERLRENKDVDGLIRALEHTDKDVRHEARKALGRIGQPAVEPLIQALKVEDEWLRVNIAWAFARIGDVRGIEQLNQLLQDKSRHVRISASNALKEIG